MSRVRKAKRKSYSSILPLQHLKKLGQHSLLIFCFNASHWNLSDIRPLLKRFSQHLTDLQHFLVSPAEIKKAGIHAYKGKHRRIPNQRSAKDREGRGNIINIIKL